MARGKCAPFHRHGPSCGLWHYDDTNTPIVTDSRPSSATGQQAGPASLLAIRSLEGKGVLQMHLARIAHGCLFTPDGQRLYGYNAPLGLRTGFRNHASSTLDRLAGQHVDDAGDAYLARGVASNKCPCDHVAIEAALKKLRFSTPQPVLILADSKSALQSGPTHRRLHRYVSATRVRGGLSGHPFGVAYKPNPTPGGGLPALGGGIQARAGDTRPAAASGGCWPASGLGPDCGQYYLPNVGGDHSHQRNHVPGALLTRVDVLQTKLSGAVGVGASIATMVTSSVVNQDNAFYHWGLGFSYPPPGGFIHVVEAGRHPASGRLVATTSWQTEEEVLGNGTIREHVKAGTREHGDHHLRRLGQSSGA
ncbi:uncharacterized protein [Dermacentor albipictus]|uniref:uncharacterized protein isoform X2 n=1 Tax=Dermacentor albipictus TaxID=60249 RepID=UPI0038FC0DD0